MKIQIKYKPTEKQAMFHACTCDEVLYGGAAGGGKSTALVMDAFSRAVATPGLQAFLFRRTYKELQDTLIAAAKRLIPAGCGKYSAVTHDYRLKNGSVLSFRHLHREIDKYMYQGVEINALYIDELTHFTRSMYDYLKTRLRAHKRLGIRPVARLSANPGGIGHGWVRERFIDCAPPMTEVAEEVVSSQTGDRLTHTRMFIPARATDNPYLNPEYIFELERKPEQLRAALLNGDWNTFSGQAFPEWRDDPARYGDGRYTHVISPRPADPCWRLTRCFDFGYSKPFSVLWCASAPGGRVYVVAEWYGASAADVGAKLDPRQIAEGILSRESELFPTAAINGVADPSIWDVSRGESVAAQMESRGVYFSPGQNARLAGKMQLHCRLAFDGQGYPGIQVFSTCREFLRTFPALTLSESNPEDVDTRCEDHSYDALRYYLMSVPKAAAPVKQSPRRYDPLADTKPRRRGFLDI